MKRRPPAAHLLVLECQAEKLAGQGLNFGSEIVAFLRTMFPRKAIVAVPTAGTPELGPSLAEIWNRHDRFRSILIVGHSNAQGLQLTTDRFFEWGAIGQWLAKFEPKFLFIAACEAGRSQAVRALFAPIPSLREVYASPIKLFADQSAPIAVLVISVLLCRKIDNDVLRSLQVANYVITGGQLYRWKRAETGEGEELTGGLWDLAASIWNRRV